MGGAGAPTGGQTGGQSGVADRLDRWRWAGAGGPAPVDRWTGGGGPVDRWTGGGGPAPVDRWRWAGAGGPAPVDRWTGGPVAVGRGRRAGAGEVAATRRFARWGRFGRHPGLRRVGLAREVWSVWGRPTAYKIGIGRSETARIRRCGPFSM
ncbi:hypothetical protein GCM10025331_71820 [Actinoplanes utahensis]|nr:hypothetical protein Aut01nite_83160 [Actinoplanes utahensis]